MVDNVIIAMPGVRNILASQIEGKQKAAERQPWWISVY
ncbi:hypothetical protein A0R60_0682 [Enterobacter asburiae]|nr:hypothetical protein A0R60_0682 [Enterobacter asburiae]